MVDARGKPDDQSREMVNGWLKRRLITDFFELLSVDGTGDSRRVDYWLQFEPAIEDMWFALGAGAQYRRGEQFNDFRNRAKGRLLTLGGTTANNNAFVMRFDQYLLVEFGAKGNAMYMFEWSALSQTVIDILNSGQVSAEIYIGLLKDRSRSLECKKHNHIDSATQSWEQKFDNYLLPRISMHPSNRPQPTDLERTARLEKSVPPVPELTQENWEEFVRSRGLRVEDNRANGGALWVLGVGQLSHIVEKLQSWGFESRGPKGWFKE